MKNLWMAMAAVAALGFSSNLMAADDCVLHVVRTACTGKDADSYKKCDGKKECDEAKAAADEAVCAAAAKEACANSRVDITKFKAVSAKFKGKDLVGGFSADGKADPAGPNFCGADRPDMNKCQ